MTLYVIRTDDADVKHQAESLRDTHGVPVLILPTDVRAEISEAGTCVYPVAELVTTPGD